MKRAERITAFALIVAMAMPPCMQAVAGETSPSNDFLRIVDDERGLPASLQAAIARYSMDTADGAVVVDLVSALHIADQPYFSALNDRFTGYDALLYELIAPPGTTVQAGEQPAGLLSRAQLAMTRGLGLSFQLEEIDYAAANFVHADLSPDELGAAMRERGETPLLFLWRIFATSMRESASNQTGMNSLLQLAAISSGGQGQSLKVTLARELTDSGQLESLLGADETSSIIGARNARAIDVLEQSIASGATRIAIFYGAAHMPDLERRLIGDLGLRYQGSEWLDAWRLDLPSGAP